MTKPTPDDIYWRLMNLAGKVRQIDSVRDDVWGIIAHYRYLFEDEPFAIQARAALGQHQPAPAAGDGLLISHVQAACNKALRGARRARGSGLLPVEIAQEVCMKATILAVADWLHAFPDDSDSCSFAASRLRREVEK